MILTSHKPNVVSLYLTNINHEIAKLQNHARRIEAVARIMANDAKFLLWPHIFQPVTAHDPEVKQVNVAVEV